MGFVPWGDVVQKESGGCRMMMERRTRKTRQRQLIYETLRATTSHPAAETIFVEVRKTMPHISLGTVYRNLGVLKDQGMIFEIPGVNHTTHYDANLEPHAHFICESCGVITDVWNCKKPSCSTAKQLEGCEVSSWSLEFRGLCPSCRNHKSI